MKIILLATWPNGQTQHIYSTSSRLIAKSQHNAKLNRHVIEVTDQTLAECIWHKTAMAQAVPLIVDENYSPIPLGSEFGPAYGYDEKGNQVVSGMKFIKPDAIKGATVVATNEPNQKETIPPVESVRQVVSEPRELPVLPEQPAAQAQEAVAQDNDVTVDEEADPEADMPLEEVICKRIAQYTKLKVETLAANLGVTVAEIKSTVKKSDFLKITVKNKTATVSAK